MYKTIEELVDKIDERNTDEGVSELIGVSIDKCFIKSVANTNGTDLSKYQNLYKYAAQSLTIAPGNVKAHYWLIVAMFNLGADEMADAQLEESRRVLTEEEYYDLTQSLKQARITEPSNLFRNEKLPM